MTCREKLKETHPDWDDERLMDIVDDCCPWSGDYRYIPKVSDEACNEMSCNECWNQEIPEEKIQGQRAKLPLIESDGVAKEIVDELLTPLDTPQILDSGDRTEFATGAVRDMREGKGRCDLTPLEVVSRFVYGDGSNSDPILDNIRSFQQTRASKYLYMALEEFNRRHWGCRYTLCLEVAKHFEEGAKKYGESNWRLGVPVWCYIDSAIRHYLKWLRGDKNEPHDRAFIWNLMCCIWEVDYHKDTVEAMESNETN